MTGACAGDNGTHVAAACSMKHSLLSWFVVPTLALSIGALQIACGEDDPGSSGDGGTSSGGSSSGAADSGTSSSGGSSSSSGGSSSGGSSSGGSSSGGADGGLEATYCADITARDERCNRVDDEREGPECAGTYACTVQRIREEARQPLLECLAARDCETIEDRCYAEAAQPFAAELGTFSQDCLAKRDSCDDNFSDDYCDGTVALGGTAVIAAAKACLEKPCGEVQGCFAQAMPPCDD